MTDRVWWMRDSLKGIRWKTRGEGAKSSGNRHSTCTRGEELIKHKRR
jgi:hypothetical protein